MSERKERGFWEVVKRLFIPVKKYPWIFFRAMIGPIFTSGIIIGSIQVIQVIIDNLEAHTLANISGYFYFFVLLTFVYLLVSGLTKNRGYSEIRPKIGNYLMQTSLEKYIKLSHTEVESLGTGRVIAIVEKGVWAHVDVIAQLFIRFGGEIVTIIFLLFIFFLSSIIMG